MDEIRMKAIEAALKCFNDGCPGGTVEQVLGAARKIEAYLRHLDGDDTPKASPHPAAVHGLAN